MKTKIHQLRAVLLIIIMVSSGYHAIATSIEVSGTISSNTTWTGVDTVKVTGDITVPDGATLTIDPGIIVEFQDRYGLLINGRLLAVGTAADSISFVPADTTGAYNFTHTGWKGIVFAQINAATDTSRISYCKLHYMNSMPLWSVSGYYNLGVVTVNEYDKLVVSHSYFYNNYGLVAGGIHTARSNIRITDCYFRNNLAKPESVAERCQGGAICIWNKTANAKYVTIERNTISNNSTLFGNIIYYGPGAGGIGCYQMKGRIASNIVTHNETEGNGGGLHLVGPDVPHICNNLITDNAVTTGAEPKYGNGGGAFLIDVDSVTFVNNTIVNNTAVRSGGGISLARFDESQAILNLVNNIIWQNTADGNPEQISLSAISSSYSINVNLYVSKTDLEGGTDDIGLAGTHTTLNIVESEWVDLDPKFSVAKENPYELSFYSPLINACDPDTTGLLVGDVDVLGNPRIYDNLVYDIIDLGAIEYQGEPSSHILPPNIYANTVIPAQWDTVRSLWGCTVHDPAKLEFSPGNYVKFCDGTQLTVLGSMGAEGTGESPIYFTAFDTTGFYNDTHAGWSGISVASGMTDTIKLIHCFLEYGKGYEFLLFGNANNITYYIDRCKIHKCRQTTVVLWLYPQYSEFILINSEISNNINDFSLGSRCCSFSRGYQNFTVSNNLFNNNYSRGHGGAIYFNPVSNWDSLTLSNNTFVNNSSELRGGAIYFETSSVYDKDITFANSIFHGNTAGMEGDNIYFSFGYCSNPFHLRNCLLEGSLSSIYFDDFFNIETLFYPERIMDKDPLFVGTGNHPYALSSLSPCINGGGTDTTGLNLPFTDMAGNPRIFDGCLDVVDIGCYEYQDEPGSLQLIYTYPFDNDTVFIEEDPVLTMDYNNTLIPQTGNISIYFKDGTLKEQIDINNSNCVTIGGQTVSIEPESPLHPRESYYVQIDASDFKDCNEQYNAGINNNTDWNFTLSGTYKYPLQALEFDGSDDYVSGTGISTSITAITLEAWIMHNSLSSGIQRYITISPEVAVLRFNNYDLNFYVKASDGSFNEITEPYIPGPGVGNWFHLTGTYDGTTMKLYLNGEEIGSNNTGGGLYAPDGGFLFSHVTETFDGKMDEVAVWNRALTIDEIRYNQYQTLTGNEAGLIDYWQLNESSGTTAIEAIQGNDGTLYNMDDSDWVVSTAPVPYESDSDGDWTNGTNWLGGQSYPSRAWSRVTINSDIDLGVDYNVIDLRIMAGHSLNLWQFCDLTVTEDMTNKAGSTGLILHSDENSTASLIYSSSSIDATVERYIPKYEANLTGWHYLSSPVTNQAIQPDFVASPPNTAEDFYKFSEPDYLWLSAKDNSGNWNNSFEDDFVVGRSYNVAYPSNETKTFSGELNVGDFTFDEFSTPAITYTASGGIGWNLMGNPYPSGLDWDECSRTNIDAAVYVFDGDAGIYLSWNGSVGGLADGIIPPMNGFFIKASENPSLTIPNDARAHASTNFLKSEEFINDLLVLRVEGNGLSDKTYIHFNPAATVGFDTEFDAYKLYGIAAAPQLYTKTGNTNLSINELPYSDEEITIPLSLEVGQDGEYTISVSQNTFWETVDILLKDLETQITYKLVPNNSITISHSTNNSPDRFLLLMNGATGIEENQEDDGIQIYSYGNKFFIRTDISHGARVGVYNMLGQQVLQRNLSGFQNLTGLNTGFYLITVSTDKTRVTKKVFIQ